MEEAAVKRSQTFAEKQILPEKSAKIGQDFHAIVPPASLD
jgi:hypothetical protein